MHFHGGVFFKMVVVSGFFLKEKDFNCGIFYGT